MASAVPPGDGPFGSAVVVPADASMVLRMRDAKGMRSDALMLRAQSSLLQLAGSRVLSQAWDTLAAELGMDPSALVDGLIGTDITYAERTRDGKVSYNRDFGAFTTSSVAGLQVFNNRTNTIKYPRSADRLHSICQLQIHVVAKY